MKKFLALVTCGSLWLGIAAAQAQHFKTNMPLRDDKAVEPQEEPYRASRGLITLEGPTGMFLNPTSATLPKGKFTLQYCLFFPNRDTDVVGHGMLLSYGITDWLEVGAITNLFDENADTDRDFVIGGPMVRVRVLRQAQWWPEISIGGYVKWGTNFLNSGSAFVALSKRLPIDPDGFFKSLTIQTGFRQTWFDKGQGPGLVRDSSRAYGGLELELPYRLYLIGEVTQKDNDFDRRTPFAYGIQCRLPGVNLTLAAMQDGGTYHDRIGIYSGVGISFGF